ncbi:MAG: hypothetical protein CMJ58_26510 [Planctomycetaceae bacterium]|nr:hypothetical protein [Planctomycetaceae bacterium]
MPLTSQQQRELKLLASIGCDRQTGCHYVGATPAALLETMRARPEFAAELLRAEATPEVMHMRVVNDAAKDVKNWRASVWWLERRAPERFARRPLPGLTLHELQAAIEHVAAAIVEEIGDATLRRRVQERLAGIATELSGAYELPVDPPATGRGEQSGETADDSLPNQNGRDAWRE